MRFLVPISLAVSLVGATPVLACGNPLLWAALFSRVPEAKAVYDADLAARQDGAMRARVFENPSNGLDYHRWSINWIQDAAVKLDETVQPLLPDGGDFVVLLADEVAAIRFEQGAEPKVISAAALDIAAGFDAITTINALESGLNHGLTALQMTELGVLSVTANRRQQVVASLF
ncbi:hypothetical protein CLV78_12128 [Aliiruegeria haliotis]|uniref:Uncharacterized protein n=1 Tax=Aliiruegeria haliotis TaxID=1280846 RepID=A0A2T0REH1_9RHOB|nr:hypothetical protein [Aliiruegeria haliotis]PRY19539.1 hypothetical protein CLV78_12128 [Aliiruegeria haliotis]